MRHRFLRSSMMMVLAGVLGTAACSNPVDPDGAHAEPHRVVVWLGGQELAGATLTAATGTLSVAVGQQTGPLTVVFLAEDGTVVEPGSTNWLRVRFDDGTVATWDQAQQGEFGGRLRGLRAGTTQAAFEFMHGSFSRGHPDWISARITIQVNP